MFDTGLTKGQLLQQIQNKLLLLRNALSDVKDMHDWSAGIGQADLTAIGFTPEDATAILTACNDANGLAILAETGFPPPTYPQPPNSYVYLASISQVIGPQ